MLTAYALTEHGPERRALPDAAAIAAGDRGGVRWVDLHNPDREEERAAEAFMGGDIPTQEEINEIEFSSRFYVSGGVTVMTASVLIGVGEEAPSLTPVSFAVAADRMVTLRYAEMTAFRQFLARAVQSGSGCGTVPGIFATLLEAIIDRTADVIERISNSVDALNRHIFERHIGSRKRSRRLAAAIGGLGAQGDLASKARESLTSLERLVQFAAAMLPQFIKMSSLSARLKLMLRDIRSLEDSVNFVLTKITFLLDATLGLISTEQNKVISVLTVVSTVLLPPTLIGAIYGMNFQNMPELHVSWGYPVALVAMVLSAVLPYLYIKWRGWL